MKTNVKEKTKCKIVRKSYVGYVECHVKSMWNSIVLTQISAINNMMRIKINSVLKQSLHK